MKKYLLLACFLLSSSRATALDKGDFFWSAALGPRLGGTSAIDSYTSMGYAPWDFWALGLFVLDVSDSVLSAGLEGRFSAEPYEVYLGMGMRSSKVLFFTGADYLFAMTPSLALKGGVKFEPAINQQSSIFSFLFGGRLVY